MEIYKLYVKAATHCNAACPVAEKWAKLDALIQCVWV